MSEYTIQLNFERALRKADELEGVSDHMKHLAEQQMHDTLNELSHQWTGENAQQFISKGGILKEKMEETARELRNTAETIRAIAEEIYEAEMEALEIARERRSR